MSRLDTFFSWGGENAEIILEGSALPTCRPVGVLQLSKPTETHVYSFNILGHPGDEEN